MLVALKLGIPFPSKANMAWASHVYEQSPPIHKPNMRPTCMGKTYLSWK